MAFFPANCLKSPSQHPTGECSLPQWVGSGVDNMIRLAPIALSKPKRKNALRLIFGSANIKPISSNAIEAIAVKYGFSHPNCHLDLALKIIPPLLRRLLLQAHVKLPDPKPKPCSPLPGTSPYEWSQYPLVKFHVVKFLFNAMSANAVGVTLAGKGESNITGFPTFQHPTCTPAINQVAYTFFDSCGSPRNKCVAPNPQHRQGCRLHPWRLSLASQGHPVKEKSIWATFSPAANDSVSSSCITSTLSSHCTPWLLLLYPTLTYWVTWPPRQFANHFPHLVGKFPNPHLDLKA